LSSFYFEGRVFRWSAIAGSRDHRILKLDGARSVALNDFARLFDVLANALPYIIPAVDDRKPPAGSAALRGR